MLRSNHSTSNPDFKRVVDCLLRSSSKFDRYENRSAHREQLAVPVQVEFRDGGETIIGLTRNVSVTGVGLLLPTACKENDKAYVTMEETHGGGKYKILSECRWCKPYGQSWFLSGWQFIKVVR